jgi:hypothetical protein
LSVQMKPGMTRFRRMIVTVRRVEETTRRIWDEYAKMRRRTVLQVLDAGLVGEPMVILHVRVGGNT